MIHFNYTKFSEIKKMLLAIDMLKYRKTIANDSD